MRSIRRKPTRFRQLTKQWIDVRVGREVAREDPLFFPVGEAPLDVGQSVHDLPQRGALHLLHGSET